MLPFLKHAEKMELRGIINFRRQYPKGEYEKTTKRNLATLSLSC
jgi:hypothetical protein